MPAAAEPDQVAAEAAGWLCCLHKPAHLIMGAKPWSLETHTSHPPLPPLLLPCRSIQLYISDRIAKSAASLQCTQQLCLTATQLATYDCLEVLSHLGFSKSYSPSVGDGDEVSTQQLQRPS